MIQLTLNTRFKTSGIPAFFFINKIYSKKTKKDCNFLLNMLYYKSQTNLICVRIGVIFFLRELYPFSSCLHIEFGKNANSIYVSAVTLISRKVSLATIGVCVFCALASVGALFIL